MNLDIDYGNIGATPALTDTIRKHAEKLPQFFDGITHCRVSIDAPHRHHQQGNAFRAHIRLIVPGTEIDVSRETATGAHEDANVVIRDAFDAARRQLQDYARRKRGDIKRHSAPTPAAQS